MHIHTVFHVSLLIPAVAGLLDEGEVEPMHPSTNEVKGDPTYRVKQFLDFRRHQGALQYLVDWMGYGAEERNSNTEEFNGAEERNSKILSQDLDEQLRVVGQPGHQAVPVFRISPHPSLGVGPGGVLSCPVCLGHAPSRSRHLSSRCPQVLSHLDDVMYCCVCVCMLVQCLGNPGDSTESRQLVSRVARCLTHILC